MPQYNSYCDYVFFWLSVLQRLHFHIVNCRLLQAFHVVKYRQTIGYLDLCRHRLISEELLHNMKLPKGLTHYVNGIVDNLEGMCGNIIIHIVIFRLTECFSTSVIHIVNCRLLQTFYVVKYRQTICYFDLSVDLDSFQQSFFRIRSYRKV